MARTLLFVFPFWILFVTVTAMQRAMPTSYSHWCPSIEMKRVSCVTSAGALQAQGARNGNGNGASPLRRAYRWKKQFVLRCCPGFMGPNCQQACFSCRGYAALKEKLTNIERLVQEIYTNDDVQPDNPARPTKPAVSFNTASGYDKTQYGTLAYQRLSDPEIGHAYFRAARTDTFESPVVVKKPPELVVALSGFPNNEGFAEEESNDTRSIAIQNDQRRNESTHGSSSDLLTTSVPVKTLSQRDDTNSKYQKWSQEHTTETMNNGKDSFTNSPTAEVETVWKHWDEEFQIRLSTLERHVLELEDKLGALDSVMASVTSLNDKIVEINKRVAAIENYSENADPVTQSSSNIIPKGQLKDNTSPMTKSNRKERRRRRNRLKKYSGKRKENDARTKFDNHSTKAEPHHDDEKNSTQNQHADQHTREKQSNSKKRSSNPSNVRDIFSTSHESEKPPSNLSFSPSKPRSKLKTSTSIRKRNDSLNLNSAGGPEAVQPTKKNNSSKISPSCANLCQGQNIPSRPPPPPLPDKEIMEEVFTGDPNLLDALDHGHKTFYQHLKAVLNRNSTKKFEVEKQPTFPPSSSAVRRDNTTEDSTLALHIGFTERIASGGQSQISDEGSNLHSELTSGKHEGQKTNFQLQRGNTPDGDESERGNAHENKIGYYNIAPQCFAFPWSVFISFSLNFFCFSVIMMFTR